MLLHSSCSCAWLRFPGCLDDDDDDFVTRGLDPVVVVKHALRGHIRTCVLDRVGFYVSRGHACM
jgi:hypothetical protein